MARYGIPFVNFEEFGALPHYLAERHAVVFPGMVPYNLWERAPDVGRIPPHRTDTGCYLVSEVFGARSMIYVKDEDGLYTADPKKDPKAIHIPRISVDELIAMDLGDLVIERAVLEFMQRARHRTEIQIINGLRPGATERVRLPANTSAQSSIAVQHPQRRAAMNDAQGAGLDAGIVELHGARHVTSRLMRESLVDKQVIASTEGEIIRILPWANVIKRSAGAALSIAAGRPSCL